MSDQTGATSDALREQVRERYAAAALTVIGNGRATCGEGTSTCCGSPDGEPAALIAPNAGPDETFGAALYPDEDLDQLPAQAVAASLGCGNPMAVASLRPGERVLDLGSGGGIDVLLSARRVGPTGKAYGLDMTDEMLDLARTNAQKAQAENVEFLKGRIEAVPLPDACIDVVISNCVINLSTDKPAVLAEMFRVLAPGGRIGISDVVAEDDVTPEERAERGSYAGCIAGALSRSEYLDGLEAAGFTDAEVEFTHEAVPGLHGAIVRARKPGVPKISKVLFVCVRNGGKSQMAAGLMEQAVGAGVQVDSAGTDPGSKLNEQSVRALAEVGVDLAGRTPQRLTEELVAGADLVVVLGREAVVDSPTGTPVRVWETDEPSERGIEGMERMRLVRDDIARRVTALAEEIRG